jgi:uncharacterized membrane protein
MRRGASQFLQVFVVVGFLFVLIGRVRGMRASRELFLLALAAFMVIALQVLLPTLSVDYGVLRAFQQALFLLAPFLVVGSIHCLGWLGARRATVAASGVAVWFFLCLTGVIPQALGAYGPQLHLNNAGEYYDLYYTRPEEDAAADWLEEEALAAGDSVVQTQLAGRFLYGIGPRMVVERSVHPARLRPGAYVLLGATTVTTGRATVSFGGDRISYEYPFGLLDQSKDLVYDNGRARIYR